MKYPLVIIIVLLLVGLAQAANNSIEVACGNDACELGENVYNCPQDCARTPFDLKTTFVNPTLALGESKEYTIDITNNLNTELAPRIVVEGDIAPFISISEERPLISARGKKTILLQTSSTHNDSPTIYNGDLTVSAGQKVTQIPLSLSLVTNKITPTILRMKVLDEIIEDPLLRIQLQIENPSIANDMIDVSYIIKEIESDEKLYSFSERIPLVFSTALVKELNVENLSIFVNNSLFGLTEQTYFIEVMSKYQQEEVLATDTFRVNKPFWSAQRKLWAASIILFLILFFGSWYGYKWYQKMKKEKARYLFPTSIKLLPQRDERSIYMGKIAETKHNMWWNPDDLTTHALVAGATGAGKSVTASIFVEGILKKKIPAIIFDPTAQWTGFVKPCKDQNLIKKYSEFGMNQDDARNFKGLIYDVDTPNIELDFKAWMNPGEVTVFNLNKLKAGEYDQAVNHIVDTIFNIKWEESTELKMLVIFDEVHRLLPKYGGEGGYLALERACREFRKWGIGLIMVSQVNADFKEALQGNILTEVQLNTKSIEDIKKMQQKYGQEYAQRISREGVGVGMIQNPRYNDGKPWFIQFRPPVHSPHKILETEMKQYQEYTDKLKLIQQTIQNIQTDTTDLELELKLATTKLKEGHFKMTNIYIESLNESLQARMKK